MQMQARIPPRECVDRIRVPATYGTGAAADRVFLAASGPHADPKLLCGVGVATAMARSSAVGLGRAAIWQRH